MATLVKEYTGKTWTQNEANVPKKLQNRSLCGKAFPSALDGNGFIRLTRPIGKPPIAVAFVKWLYLVDGRYNSHWIRPRRDLPMIHRQQSPFWPTREITDDRLCYHPRRLDRRITTTCSRHSTAPKTSIMPPGTTHSQS
jgi:hypothetical protein